MIVEKFGKNKELELTPIILTFLSIFVILSAMHKEKHEERKIIPSWVEAVKPTRVDFPLEGFTTDGELFATDQQLRDFFSDTVRTWSETPTRERYDGPPTVIHMDFSSVRQIRPDGLDVGFVFVVVNFTGQLRPVYLTLDNLDATVAEDFQKNIEKWRRKSVVVARTSGAERYKLLGSPVDVKRFRPVFETLVERNGWVRGIDFSRETWSVQSQTRDVSPLREMAQKGVILSIQRPTGCYYCSLV